MKGIILAGGSGTRLYPLTLVTSKQLLPVYDKPMIYYPLSVLMMAGIQDILILSTPEDTPRFEELLKDGLSFGIHLSYLVQPKPEGLAQAFLLGESFLGKDSACMVLGDNIFHGDGLIRHLQEAKKRAEKGTATVFAYPVKDPERFGTAVFGKDGKPLRIVEKSPSPQSNQAITGLYFYPQGVSSLAKTLTPSERGELEITDLNNLYLQQRKMEIDLLGRGYSWLDTGTMDSLTDACFFVKAIEDHQDRKLCCPEEIAFNNGWIDREELLKTASKMAKSDYGQYLFKIAKLKDDTH